MSFKDHKFLSRLVSRPDTEHKQAYLRALSAAMGLIIVMAVHQFGQQSGGWTFGIQLLTIAIGATTGVFGLLAWIMASPAPNVWRRWIGITHDMTWTGFTFYALGDSGLIVFAMYVWIVIGNGFRYGVRYLYGSAALALASFYTVAYFSPYYRSNYGLLGLGTFLLAVVIPVYLGSLLKALQRNLEAAREADRAKTRFVANVSHDLRTPLNAIMANCEVLARDLRKNGEPPLQLRDMQEAALTLNNLVSDLLDVAKIEAGRISIKSAPFNLAELLGRVVRLNEPATGENGVQIHLTLDAGTPVYVHGDDLRLEQILNNIVSNAIKHTENGYIHIHAEPDMHGPSDVRSAVVISIRDTGTGVTPEARDRIFTRFEQADTSYARTRSGAGLGLSIARELVNLMGGSITVESTIGIGSCFRVSIPLPITNQPGQILKTDHPLPELVVICQGETDRQHWAALFDGGSLPLARVVTTRDVVAGEAALREASPSHTCVVVDAEQLQPSPAELPRLMRRSYPTANTALILLNAQRIRHEDGSLREYRCVCAGSTPEDINKCLEIAYWSTSSYPTEIEDGGHLQVHSQTLKGCTVLVADDNELNRRLIFGMLDGLDSRILEANNGREALEMLTDEQIDVALLDVQMPELSGIEVMRAAAELSRPHPTPIIALTADTTDECRFRCIEAGATAILHKPVSMQSLYQELHRAIADAHTDRAEPAIRGQPTVAGHSDIDYALLHELARSAQRPDYLASLTSCFRIEGARLLEELRHAFRIEDLENSRALLHRLKGMSSAIGANLIARLCHDRLAAPDTQLRASGGALTEQLCRLHHDAAEALENFLSRVSPLTPS